jgi:hypothetical protein
LSFSRGYDTCSKNIEFIVIEGVFADFLPIEQVIDPDLEREYERISKNF